MNQIYKLDIMIEEKELTLARRLIGPIAASAAMGDLQQLDQALHRGLDAGLTVSQVKEILVQLYAYAGFPRSLNALGQLMKTIDARKARGLHDALGTRPAREILTGEALLRTGTANQTKLAGAPVKGPLFDFAPAIDTFLKTHLFGDIFQRDNLDWSDRELATVSMLAGLEGVDSQLQSHISIALNVGVTVRQMRELVRALDDADMPEAAGRLGSSLDERQTTSS